MTPNLGKFCVIFIEITQNLPDSELAFCDVASKVICLNTDVSWLSSRSTVALLALLIQWLLGPSERGPVRKFVGSPSLGGERCCEAVRFVRCWACLTVGDFGSIHRVNPQRFVDPISPSVPGDIYWPNRMLSGQIYIGRLSLQTIDGGSFVRGTAIYWSQLGVDSVMLMYI